MKVFLFTLMATLVILSINHASAHAQSTTGPPIPLPYQIIAGGGGGWYAPASGYGGGGVKITGK